MILLRIYLVFTCDDSIGSAFPILFEIIRVGYETKI